MITPDEVLGTPQHHRNRKGGAMRTGNMQLAELADRDLRAAVLAKHIRELADAHPPLTAEQRRALAALLLIDREENDA